MSDKEYFRVYGNAKLHQDMLAARAAGRRKDGKLYSCAMAFEIGAEILLRGRDDEGEEAILQRLENIRTEKATLEFEERMSTEQLSIMQANKAAKRTAAAEQNDNVQKLAQRIMDVWDKVVIDHNHLILGSLVDIDKTRLTRSKLESVFPKRYAQKPSSDEAIKIAIDLLGFEGESVGA